jgi:hypothetical protein
MSLVKPMMLEGRALEPGFYCHDARSPTGTFEEFE